VAIEAFAAQREKDVPGQNVARVSANAPGSGFLRAAQAHAATAINDKLQRPSVHFVGQELPRSGDVAKRRITSDRIDFAAFSNSKGMAVATPTGGAAAFWLRVGLAGVWSSLTAAAASMRCEISGRELMIAFR
jgi:hypothetical protein